MDNLNFNVKLSHAEVEYLSNANFLTSSQLAMLSNAESSVDGVNLILTKNSAEGFRDKFTEELARVGFDENYETTTEGQMLEELIDRFFMS